MRKVETTPEKMVEKNGTINFGTFRTPFADANILDAPFSSSSRKVSAFWKKFRLKEWQHFGIITPTHYFGMVIFDAKFMGVSFFYAYDRIANKRFEHSAQLPGRASRVAAQVYDDHCEFAQKGYRLRIENRLKDGFHKIIIDIEGKKNLPAVKGEVKVFEDLKTIEPLVQVSPVTHLRPFYTHKVAAPTEGTIRLGSKEIILDRKQDIALLDEQKTYYPYVSFWKWSTAAGYNEYGELLAFNLCQNMITDDEDFNENCMWVDGKIYCLKAARFNFDAKNMMRPWEMKTNDGYMDLLFTPSGERAEKISIGFIKSDFHQPFGMYNGRFKDENNRLYPITNFFGLAEHHVTRY
ncbi:MAG: hypothetical protein CVU55_08325 [Deltaproteobacteria bacterium HGW-Deltaproteobacteria-13]|jgi:hypothetical protein|nr:MAG: hypothetical protein CVU55_08325 [Deltaproteobacteria bacterium HGW-Deltaproteobacteria-13]